jgi:hypothetical protein
VSWRPWFAVVFVALAVAAACSGKTNAPPAKGKGGGAGVGAAGTGGRGGTGGRPASVGGSFGEAGEGGAPFTPTGGSAGAPVAGSVGLGGTGNVAGASLGGVAGQNVAGFAGSAPFRWTCAPAAYGDGTCDCGCGTADPDCKDARRATCDVCNGIGSCNGLACPGRIDENDTARCEPVPPGWLCGARAYEDGESCDCGCGVPDPDCDGEDRAACDTCNVVGSCSRVSCPGAIDDADNSKCTLPWGWSCNELVYGDGVCDCGCEARDVDCPSASVEDCQQCDNGCSLGDACPGKIYPENSAFCREPPFGWNCSPRFYADGMLCHCGCGTPDPDCNPAEVESCDRCNTEGSCSVQECPGTISPEYIQFCMQPEPPEEWICEPFDYGEGSFCDCGCGAVDIDCRGTTPAACDRCGPCGPCPDRVDPADISACLPPPDDWTCADELYADGGSCDCGCGVLDPDCFENDRGFCTACPDGSCSRSDCRDLDPEDVTVCEGGVPPGWTCPADYFGDFGCDCGCGAQDQDCSSLSASVCEFCDSPGSCSEETPTCPGDIDPVNNAVCGSN